MSDIITNEVYQVERDKMRRAVLDALDQWARDEFNRSRGGWQDKDLANLFAALDRHFDACLSRFGISNEGKGK